MEIEFKLLKGFSISKNYYLFKLFSFSNRKFHCSICDGEVHSYLGVCEINLKVRLGF